MLAMVHRTGVVLLMGFTAGSSENKYCLRREQLFTETLKFGGSLSQLLVTMRVKPTYLAGPDIIKIDSVCI